MVILILLVVTILTALIIFIKLRQSRANRQWLNQTSGERIALSFMSAATIQILYFIRLPGWLVAAYLIGYSGSGSETFLTNTVWGIVMVAANILIYLPIFYLVFILLDKFFRRRQA